MKLLTNIYFVDGSWKWQGKIQGTVLEPCFHFLVLEVLITCLGTWTAKKLQILTNEVGFHYSSHPKLQRQVWLTKFFATPSIFNLTFSVCAQKCFWLAASCYMLWSYPIGFWYTNFSLWCFTFVILLHCRIIWFSLQIVLL